MYPYNTEDNMSTYAVRVRHFGGGGGSSGGERRGLGISDISRICSQKYKNNQHQVIVIVLARYSISSVKKMVDENYEYWHHFSENDTDFFWLGYYMNNYRYKNSVPDSISLAGDTNSLVFDTAKYVEEVKLLSSLLKGNRRLGSFTGFLLCNYYKGELHYKKSVLIDIESLLKNDHDAVLRKVADCLIEASSREKEAKNVATIIKDEMRLSELKEKIGAAAGTILTGAGIIIEIL